MTSLLILSLDAIIHILFLLNKEGTKNAPLSVEHLSLKPEHALVTIGLLLITTIMDIIELKNILFILFDERI